MSTDVPDELPPDDIADQPTVPLLLPAPVLSQEERRRLEIVRAAREGLALGSVDGVPSTQVRRLAFVRWLVQTGRLTR